MHLTNRAGMTICLVLAPLFLIACPRKETSQPPRVAISEQPSTPTPAATALVFNGERALEHVRKQLEFGPRPPGSPELAKTRQYITNELKSAGMFVSTDEFNPTTPQGAKKMVNITAEIPGESKDVIIIGSHYDSKYFKDMQFLGANDPGASVGTLLELGRVLGETKPRFTYWLVFFDGEEAFCENWDDCGKPEAPDNTYGSRHYVSQLRTKKELERVRALILLDMIGYKNLELGRDTISTKWLQDILWQTARELGYQAYFVDRPEGVGGDDHEPFLRAGIPSVDLIQLNNYPYWHKADDTLDKVSAKSMKIVGDVVSASLPRIEQRLLSRVK